MAKQQSNNGPKYKKVDDDFATPWKDYSEGDSMEGVYAGSQQVTGGPNDNTFLSHRLKREDGTFVGVAGSTLDTRMAKVPIGAQVRITFTGREPSKRGTDMKMFEVEVGESTNLIDPLDIARAAAAQP